MKTWNGVFQIKSLFYGMTNKQFRLFGTTRRLESLFQRTMKLWERFSALLVSKITEVYTCHFLQKSRSRKIKNGRNNIWGWREHGEACSFRRWGTNAAVIHKSCLFYKHSGFLPSTVLKAGNSYLLLHFLNGIQSASFSNDQRSISWFRRWGKKQFSLSTGKNIGKISVLSTFAQVHNATPVSINREVRNSASITWEFQKSILSPNHGILQVPALLTNQLISYQNYFPGILVWNFILN